MSSIGVVSLAIDYFNHKRTPILTRHQSPKAFHSFILRVNTSYMKEWTQRSFIVKILRIQRHKNTNCACSTVVFSCFWREKVPFKKAPPFSSKSHLWERIPPQGDPKGTPRLPFFFSLPSMPFSACVQYVSPPLPP